MATKSKPKSRREMLRERNANQKYGAETPDPTLHEGYMPRPEVLTLKEEMQRFIKAELSAKAEEHGFESFEEADDFDLPEEDAEEELDTPYTVRDAYDPLTPFDDLEGDPNADTAQKPAISAEAKPEGQRPVSPQMQLSEEQMAQLIDLLQQRDLSSTVDP